MKKRVASRLSDADFIRRVSPESRRKDFIHQQYHRYDQVDREANATGSWYDEWLARTEAVRKELEPLKSKASVMTTFEWGLKHQDWVTMNDCLNSHQSTYNDCARLNSRWEQSDKSYDAKRNSVVGQLNQLIENSDIEDLLVKFRIFRPQYFIQLIY